MPEKSYKLFKKKDQINELLDDSTVIFHHNKLGRYTDHPNEHFRNGRYRQIGQLCLQSFCHYIMFY